MKVYDIISEDARCGPGYVMGPAGLCIPITPTPKPPPVPPAPKPVPPKPKLPGKAIEDLIKNAQTGWRKNTTRASRIEKIWMGRYGTSLTYLMKFLGLAIPLTNLYSDLAALKEEYIADKWTKEEYIAGREYLFGVFTVQFITPMVVRWLANTRIVLAIARVIKNLLAAASAPVSAGASIAVALGTEAGFIALQTFLSSNAGKDWLTNFLSFGLVRTMGKIPETVWSSFTDAYNKVDKDKLKKKDPAKAAEVEKQEKQDKDDLEKAKDFRKELGV